MPKTSALDHSAIVSTKLAHAHKNNTHTTHNTNTHTTTLAPQQLTHTHIHRTHTYTHEYSHMHILLPCMHTYTNHTHTPHIHISPHCSTQLPSTTNQRYARLDTTQCGAAHREASATHVVRIANSLVLLTPLRPSVRSSLLVARERSDHKRRRHSVLFVKETSDDTFPSQRFPRHPKRSHDDSSGTSNNEQRRLHTHKQRPVKHIEALSSHLHIHTHPQRLSG